MKFASIVNFLSKTYNKALMTFLAVVIFGILLERGFNAEDFHLSSIIGITLLVIWSIFTIISFFYTLNGIMLNASFKGVVNDYMAKGKPIQGIRGFDDLMGSKVELLIPILYCIPILSHLLPFYTVIYIQ